MRSAIGAWPCPREQYSRPMPEAAESCRTSVVGSTPGERINTRGVMFEEDR